MAPALRTLFAHAGRFCAQIGLPCAQAGPEPLPSPRPSSHSLPSFLADNAALGWTDSECEHYTALGGAPLCPIDGPLSCHNSTPITDGADSCCFVHPGGRMLLTQFWDEDVLEGAPPEDWTMHGLWPDLCDGTYDAFCHNTPRFNNITEVLEHHGQDELLDFMNKYWIAARGSNAHFWAHEFNKHATCINTLAPSCYSDQHAPGAEVVDYFSRAAGLFRMLDTRTALNRAGIVPAAHRHYPLADIIDALERFAGGKVVLRCDGRRHDRLHEVWYVYHVRGSLQTGEFVPAQDLGAHGDVGNCRLWVRYPPKNVKGGGLLDFGRSIWDSMQMVLGGWW